MTSEEQKNIFCCLLERLGVTMVWSQVWCPSEALLHSKYWVERPEELA